MEKEKIRPFYSELQGYLSQSPPLSSDFIWEESVWTQYNETIKLLSDVSGEELSRFSVKSKLYDHKEPFVKVIEYRQKLGGLISYLQGKYFPDEPAPFSGMPTTVISQSQQQNQTIQMLFEIRDKIEAKMPDYPEGSKERKFLQKFKDSFTSISNWTQLLTQLFKMAKDFGLDIDSITKIFG
ncbi:MAG: hypothetical protein ABSB32_08600 [Thermodesulfobacteriota bacterium]|jgi:hypothetical protein